MIHETHYIDISMSMSKQKVYDMPRWAVLRKSLIASLQMIVYEDIADDICLLVKELEDMVCEYLYLPIKINVLDNNDKGFKVLLAERSDKEKLDISKSESLNSKTKYKYILVLENGSPTPMFNGRKSTLFDSNGNLIPNYNNSIN